MSDPISPKLSDQSSWSTEHTALFLGTIKWAILGVLAGLAVGLASRAFLWALRVGGEGARRLDVAWFHYYYFLPLALIGSVWLIRTFAPTAKGHGTEAVITAVHTQNGKVDWRVAPIKLLASVLTLAFGGSVGKEGPTAQIGAAITSLFADVLRLDGEDRRRLVICGIGAGFAAVFGTPVSGALFGLEVLYLGRIEYPVLFPCLLAGITAHIVCGAAPPIPHVRDELGGLTQLELVPIAIACGAAFGIVALLLIESMRALGKVLRRFEHHPYLVAAGGGIALVGLYCVFGDAFAGLGTDTIEGALAGTVSIFALGFLIKIITTSVTLESGGSGGIVTPLFFIGSTSGLAIARLFHLPEGLLAAFGFVAVVAAAANTPIAAAVMGMEMLPGPVGVYAALCACTAFLIVGHRSVYASQKLGFSKSPWLVVELGGAIGDVTRASTHLKPGLLPFGRLWRRPKLPPTTPEE